MFTIPRPNVVSSDEGFSVEVLGRTGVRYQDQSGTVNLDGEMLAGPAGFMIYRDSMLEIGNGDGAELGDVRKNLIIENIRRAFAYRGFEIEVL